MSTSVYSLQAIYPPPCTHLKSIQSLAQEGARKQLGKALEWRDEHLPPPGMPHVCERCEEGGKNTHCFFSMGLDKLGRNVLYANSARALCNEAQGCVLHMTRTLEIGFARPEVAEKWVWIIDFNGFTMKQALQIKTSVAVMQCFGDIMPERVGLVCHHFSHPATL